MQFDLKNVLFVCQANIGRSQMAERFYSVYSRGKPAKSAGVDDFGKKYGYHPTPEIVQIMKEKGCQFDVSEQKIKQLTPDMLHQASVIVVFCEKERFLAKYRQYRGKAVFTPVPDPHEQSAESIRRVRNQVELIVKMLLTQTSQAKDAQQNILKSQI